MIWRALNKRIAVTGLAARTCDGRSCQSGNIASRAQKTAEKLVTPTGIEPVFQP
jgi:hypothetical protein